jgi:pyruvate formate lyase activating enzyme
MDMSCFGITDCSTQEIDKEVAMIIFTQRCPLSCVYCHNHKMVRAKKSYTMKVDAICRRIAKAAPLITTVAFSGGEPLLEYEQVKRVAMKAKKCKLKVAVETSGVLPSSLSEMISEHLVDIILMDIKAPLDDTFTLERVCKGGRFHRKMLDSIRIISRFKGRKIARCTVTHEHFGFSEIADVAKLAKPFNEFVVQNVKPELAPIEDLHAIPVETLSAMISALKKEYPNIRCRY